MWDWCSSNEKIYSASVNCNKLVSRKSISRWKKELTLPSFNILKPNFLLRSGLYAAKSYLISVFWRDLISKKSSRFFYKSLQTFVALYDKLKWRQCHVLYFCICICFDGVIIAAQCTATFLRFIVLPRNWALGREYAE